MRCEKADHWIAALAALAVAAVTGFTFLPVLENGFVNWGDYAELVNNPNYRGFSSDKLQWMLTANHMGHYHPLTWLTLAADYGVWGLDPRGYHLTTLVLHAACSAAAFYLIRDLLRVANPARSEASPRLIILCAAAGALLFSLHPLRVEPVAWTTERRSSLSGLLLILATTMYVRYVLRRRGDFRNQGALQVPDARSSASRHPYWACFALYFASLLSKEFGFTFPVVLLILDLYPLRRWGVGRGELRRLGRLAQEKLPFWGLTALWVVIAVWSSVASNVAKPYSEYGISQRLAQAVAALHFYMQKTVWPIDLLPIYSIPPDIAIAAPRYLLSAAVVIGFTAAIVLLRKRWPAALAIWAVTVVVLAPVLGFTQTGRQLAADRYMYLPHVALGAGVAALLFWAWSGGMRRRLAAPATAFVIGVLAACMLLARQQIPRWHDSRSLWAHTVARAPRCPVANTNFGVLLGEAGDADGAVEYFRKALACDARHVDALNNWGIILAQKGQLREALEKWEMALRIDPQASTIRGNAERARAMLGG